MHNLQIEEDKITDKTVMRGTLKIKSFYRNEKDVPKNKQTRKIYV